jgi:hypothetical protein
MGFQRVSGNYREVRRSGDRAIGSEASLMRRRCIFLFAGPALGWIGFCLAAAISHGPRNMGLVVPGMVVFSPFIFAAGALPAIFTFWVDDALIERNSSRPLRAILCCAFGGLLSLGLFRYAPFPLPEFRSEGLVNALPGAFAGLICSYWAGREKSRPKSRGTGWSIANRE